MARLNVRKTYKLYINGEFPRTESGRFYAVHGKGGELLANACRGSRKDLRNAVVAARKAFSGWSGKTGYNRGQILYRIAEVCESRAAELADELRRQGSTAAPPRRSSPGGAAHPRARPRATRTLPQCDRGSVRGCIRSSRSILRKLSGPRPPRCADLFSSRGRHSRATLPLCRARHKSGPTRCAET